MPPEHLGPNLPNLLQQTLLAQVEGHCTGRHGYIIAVLGYERTGKGMVQDGSGTGSVEFKIKYRAIVLKPFKNEVVDAVVVTVNKMGFFAEVGPLNIFVSNHVSSFLDSMNVIHFTLRNRSLSPLILSLNQTPCRLAIFLKNKYNFPFGLSASLMLFLELENCSW